MMNIKKIMNQKILKTLPLLAVLALLLLSWSRFGFSLWFFVLAVISLYWYALSRQYFDIILSIFSVAVLFSAINTATYFLGHSVGFQITPLLILLSHIISALILWFFGKKLRPFKPIENSDRIGQYLLLLGGGLLLGFLILPFFSVTPIERINLLSIGEDNISHFALHHSVFEHGFLAGTVNPGVIPGLRDYPQGLHALYATITKLLFGQNPSLNEIVNSHILQMSLTYCFFIVALGYVAYRLIIKGCQQRVRHLAGLAALPLMGIVSLGIVFYLFTHGFHTQIYSYFLLLLVPLVYEEVAEDNARYFILSIIFALLCYSWFILIAAMGLYMLLMIFLKQSRFPSIKALLLATPFLLLGALYFTLRPAAQHGGGSALLLGGAVVPVQLFDFLIVLAGGVLCLAVLRIVPKFKATRSYAASLTAFFLAICAEIILIGVYQQIKIHRFAYFYYKSVYLPYALLLILTLVLGIIIVIYFVEQQKKYLIPYNLLILAIVGMLSTAVVIKLYNQPYPRGYWNKTLITAVDSSAIATIYTSQAPPKDIIYPDTCESYKRYITMRWVGALLLNDSKERHDYLVSFLNSISNENQDYFTQDIVNGALLLQNKTCNDPDKS